MPNIVAISSPLFYIFKVQFNSTDLWNILNFVNKYTFRFMLDHKD